MIQINLITRLTSENLMVQRNLSLDILKVALSFFVVALHCQFLLNVNVEAYFATVHGIFRLAVPIFLVISGYFFYNVSKVEDFKKWIFRVGLLYLIWMTIYSPFWFKVSRPLLTIFTMFNGYFVLWYLIGTLISGAITFKIKNLNTKILLSIVFLTFLTGFILQTLGNLHIFQGKIDNILNLNYVHRNAFFMCLPFFLIGYLINKHSIDKSKNFKLTQVLLVILAVALEAVLQSKLISNTEGIDQLLTLPIASIVIFIYFKNKQIFGKTKDLANFSTAVYLIHPLFLLLIIKYTKMNETALTAIVLLLSIAASFLLLKLNQKFKYLL